MAEQTVDLWYPRNEDSPIKRIRITLMDVRAANNLVIDYDFDRDGWRIQMPTVHQWTAEQVAAGEDDDRLQEVAFVPAWATGEPD